MSEQGTNNAHGCSPVLVSLLGALLISLMLIFAIFLFTEVGDGTLVAAGLVTVTPSITPTLTPSVTSTPTITLTPTLTAPPTDTARPTNTFTPSATPTSTNTPTPTDTPTPTPTFTPWPTPDVTTRTLRVPILMYHHIAVPGPDADVFERDLSVLPDDFAAQLAWLRDNGYTTISLYDLQYALTLGWPLPPKPIILTFDDGYADAYTNAYPLLRQYGFGGTFFIVTGFVDNGYENYATWPQLEEMAASGMDLEPHSRDHSDLRNRDRDYLVWQILGPRETLAAHIGHEPRFFAYPSGHYDNDVIQILKEANFWGAVTTQWGTTHSLDHAYELTRMRVRGGESLDTFITTLTP